MLAKNIFFSHDNTIKFVFKISLKFNDVNPPIKQLQLPSSLDFEGAVKNVQKQREKYVKYNSFCIIEEMSMNNKIHKILILSKLEGKKRKTITVCFKLIMINRITLLVMLFYKINVYWYRSITVGLY